METHSITLANPGKPATAVGLAVGSVDAFEERLFDLEIDNGFRNGGTRTVFRNGYGDDRPCWRYPPTTDALALSLQAA